MKYTKHFYVKIFPLMLVFAFVLTAFPVTMAANNVLPFGTKQHYIPWPFVTHLAPDFMTATDEIFLPQTVIMYIVKEDGWALINTADGMRWVYIDDNLRYIDKRMGLFDNKGDTESIDMINPQVVKIMEQDGSWLKISTWLGPKWIDLAYMPPSTALEKFMQPYKKTVSVYYENLATGFVYRYNPDTLYNTASIIKAPYCLYIYQLAEQGLTDLRTLHTYTSKDYRGGSGTIQYMKTGTMFTEGELLMHTIRESDNVAMKMLMNTYGVNDFKKFVVTLGGNPDLINNILYTNPTAKMNVDEAALYTKAIYDYIEGGYTYSKQFKSDLLATTFTPIVSDFPVADKYGSANNLNAFHDMGIVYADSPYILVIMSKRSQVTDEDLAVFKAISMEIQHFNTLYFEK